MGGKKAAESGQAESLGSRGDMLKHPKGRGQLPRKQRKGPTQDVAGGRPSLLHLAPGTLDEKKEKMQVTEGNPVQPNERSSGSRRPPKKPSSEKPASSQGPPQRGGGKKKAKKKKVWEGPQTKKGGPKTPPKRVEYRK